MKKGSVHDHFFRLAMSEPQIAQAFFERHLPEKIKKIIKLDTLYLCRDTFVNAKLKLAATDMLFSAEYAHRPGLLYFLPEHRSKPTRWQAFIILVYLVRAMENHRKQTKDRYLPAIYPMVFYHGKRSYSQINDLSKLFDCPQEIPSPITCSQIQLVNLNTIADEVLTTHNPWLNIMHTVMKHIYAPDILPHIEKLGDAWNAVDRAGGYDFLEGTFNYVFTAANVKDYNKLFEVIRKNIYSNHLRENVMGTIAQQLREEGRQEVMGLAQQFKEEGRQEVMGLAQQLKEEGRQEVMGLAQQLKEEGRQEVMGLAQQFKEEGHQLGHQKGWRDAIKAIKLLQNGTSIQQVAQLTQLPVEVLAMLEQEEII